MDAGQEEPSPNKCFRKQLETCVRRVDWIYAIFWSRPSLQEGRLEWREGYYNGEIKTRKTTMTAEKGEGEEGGEKRMRRSEQLRELYESLCAGEAGLQNRRPCASLSPEDLSDAEWYYLVCMTFHFEVGRDLAGKAYELNEPIWLSNAQFSESTSFSRSLLAKSASIQTVVCIPFIDGVLELGTSGLILEDPGFAYSITSSFWEIPLLACSDHSASSSMLLGEENNVCLISDNEVHETIMLEKHALVTENDTHAFPFSIDSYDPINEIERLNVSLQAHKWNLLADQFNHGQNGSLRFSEGASSIGELLREDCDKNHVKLSSLEVEGDATHYASTLSVLLGNLKETILPPGGRFQNRVDDSSFKPWRRCPQISKIFVKTPQRMLKRILSDRNWMNGGQSVKLNGEENMPRSKAYRSEADDANANHVLSERRRREKLNEKFLILRSLVPSISKVDKASILSDTIEYLKELESRVEELEFYREDIRERRKYPDITERTSDNYGNSELSKRRKSSTFKRKASEIDDEESEQHLLLLSKSGIVDLNVTVIDEEVLVELHCPWRDCLLLDLIEAMNYLRLDASSLCSSTAGTNVAIALRAKFMSTAMAASPGMIKRAIQRVVGKRNSNF